MPLRHSETMTHPISKEKQSMLLIIKILHHMSFMQLATIIQMAVLIETELQFLMMVLQVDSPLLVIQQGFIRIM